MPKIVCLSILIALTTPLWSQVEPAASGGGFSLDDDHMMTPPPVSGDAYPVFVGSEMRSNFLSGGLVVSAAYQDNIQGGSTPNGEGDETYSFLPTITVDRRGPRHGDSLTYSSGFQLYQKTSELNGVTQDASGGYRFHLSPYAVITFGDTFRQNYNLYNQPNPFTGSGVSGAPGSPNTVLVAPFANQIGNTSNAGIDYQYGRDAMIGAQGSYATLRYSGHVDSLGLDNSNTTNGSVFFSRRLTRSQYMGASYGLSKLVTHPIDTYTMTHTLFVFYTIYLTRSFSFSVLGGPEQYTSWSPLVPKTTAWTPAVQGSVGWQTPRANLAASYAHVVSGAGGLIGTYHSDFASVTGRLLLSPRWSVGASTEYANFKNVSTTGYTLDPGGRTVSGSLFLEHRLTERINAEAGYSHFHQGYSNIPAASTSPDSNRAFVSVSYQFSRPLGR